VGQPISPLRNRASPRSATCAGRARYGSISGRLRLSRFTARWDILGFVATAFGAVRSVSVDGTALAYREQGEGEPVVFVHGDISDLRTWEQQIPAVGASYRAITYSRRYARPNEDIEPAVDNQMLPHVDDLAAFLRAIDAAPAHLVGNSWGAFIALLTAVRHPDLIRALVLEEPPVLPQFVSTPPRFPELLRLLILRPRTTIALIGFGAKVIGPVQKAFRRDDDEIAMLTFVNGVLGRDAYEQLPGAPANNRWSRMSARSRQRCSAPDSPRYPTTRYAMSASRRY
jgi:pimeloyl-ACP methyl ester carboxylesterase